MQLAGENGYAAVLVVMQPAQHVDLQLQLVELLAKVDDFLAASAPGVHGESAAYDAGRPGLALLLAGHRPGHDRAALEAQGVTTVIAASVVQTGRRRAAVRTFRMNILFSLLLTISKMFVRGE